MPMLTLLLLLPPLLLLLLPPLLLLLLPPLLLLLLPPLLLLLLPPLRPPVRVRSGLIPRLVVIFNKGRVFFLNDSLCSHMPRRTGEDPVHDVA